MDPRFRGHFYRDGVVPTLVELVAAAPREKVVRLAISVLRNLAECTSNGATGLEDIISCSAKDLEGRTFLKEMIGCGLMKWIGLMKERKWSDPDIVEGKTIAMKHLYFGLLSSVVILSFDVLPSRIQILKFW
jgi:V-type H+-transporting ATPase subunit H